MPAYLKSDPTRGPGCGVIEVPGFALSAQPTFVLQRSSDGQCLSLHGWQAAEAPLTPDAWDADSGVTRMAVGPQVVDHMDELDTYRLTLRQDGAQPHVQTLLVQGLVYSSMHGGQGMQGASPVQPVPPPPPAPEPLPEPEPLVEATETPLSMTPPPAPEIIEEKRSKAPLLIALLILLFAAGGGLWWYLQQQKSPADTTAAPNTAQSAPAAEAQPAPAAPKLSPLQAAREHLRSGGDAAKGLELAKSADMQTAEAADAVFLLVEDAAQKGQAEAMLRLAAFYDPSDAAPKGSIKGDAAEALSWYQKAKDAGQAEAEAKMTALRQWQEGQKTAPAAPASTAAPAQTPAPQTVPQQAPPAAPTAPATPATPTTDAKPQ